MFQEIETLKAKFESIKKAGWIKSVREGNSGVGVTLEHLIGIPENTLEIPDFQNIEIKAKRSYSKSYTTLFSYNPEGPHYYEIERLQQKYGYPDSKFKQYKVLNCSVYANEKVKVGLYYYFKLRIDRTSEKIFLTIIDLNGNVIEDDVYWSFDTLKEKLYRKCQYIAFFKAIRKFINKEEYFKYYKMNIYKLKCFEEFINLLEQGIIRITLKININKKEPYIGQIKNHGTGFCIKEEDFSKLYDLISSY